MGSKLYWLLVLVPVSVMLRLWYPDPVVLFFVAGLAILPLSGIMGLATEDLAALAGPRWGGFLNATFGNLAELIIALFAVWAGLLEVVKASITGSIMGNILLVLGLAIFIGGTKHRRMTFNAASAGVHSSMLFLATIALIVPAVFLHSAPETAFANIEGLSLGVAGILLIVYSGSLVFSFVTHESLLRGPVTGEVHEPRWTLYQALAVLTAAAAVVAVESEFLVGSIEGVIDRLGLTELFIGVIIVPLVGNAAEHFTAVLMAYKGKMDVAMEIAIGSSTQIALFVAPVIVFVSLIPGHAMTYIFNPFELAAIGFSVVIASLMALDGETNWFEGIQLLAAYLIIATAFYFVA